MFRMWWRDYLGAFPLFAILAMVFYLVSLFGMYQHEKAKVKELTQQIIKQNMAIDEWVRQTREANEKMKILQKQAVSKLSASKRESSAIMALTVPKDCEKAISWGIEQAINMKDSL